MGQIVGFWACFFEECGTRMHGVATLGCTNIVHKHRAQTSCAQPSSNLVHNPCWTRCTTLAGHGAQPLLDTVHSMLQDTVHSIEHTGLHPRCTTLVHSSCTNIVHKHRVHSSCTTIAHTEHSSIAVLTVAVSMHNAAAVLVHASMHAPVLQQRCASRLLL